MTYCCVTRVGVVRVALTESNISPDTIPKYMSLFTELISAYTHTRTFTSGRIFFIYNEGGYRSNDMAKCLKHYVLFIFTTHHLNCLSCIFNLQKKKGAALSVPGPHYTLVSVGHFTAEMSIVNVKEI